MEHSVQDVEGLLCRQVDRYWEDNHTGHQALVANAEVWFKFKFQWHMPRRTGQKLVLTIPNIVPERALSGTLHSGVFLT